MTLVKNAKQKNIFLFPNQNICCGYPKEPPQRDGSTYAKIMDKKIFTI